MKFRHVILTAAALAGVAACSGSSYSTGPSGNPPPPNTVDATASLAFLPSTLTVASGTSVTFAFASVAHNVTFTAATGVPADIPTSSNTSVQRTFATTGTFSYHCTIHPQMTGTVVVQ
ncbi:MAG: plastocyanin/azurin family copper-binding protein [Gemmatimonadales bacterium]